MENLNEKEIIENNRKKYNQYKSSNENCLVQNIQGEPLACLYN